MLFQFYIMLLLNCRSLIHFPCQKGAHSVQFDRSGRRLLCLRRRQNPILYDLQAQDEELMNGITLPSPSCANNFPTAQRCTFAGSDDQFAVCGSDGQFFLLCFTIL